MDHIESVHNESIRDDENYESGIVNVKFSSKSPNKAGLEALNGDRNLNEQKCNSVAIGNVNVISILKKTVVLTTLSGSILPKILLNSWH